MFKDHFILELESAQAQTTLFEHVLKWKSVFVVVGDSWAGRF